jgi:DNA primase
VLIPEHKIEEVLARVDLVALVSRHVELKKSGRSYKGRCPFHQEKSPSFYVTPEMRRFKCFGCQAGGDAISFVQRLFGKSFMDAVKDLAREAGVDLEAAVDPSARERQQLKEATDVAQEHFRKLLWSPEGQSARAYLSTRGLSDDTIREFGLGFAPPEWESLSKELLARGVLEFGFKAGLVLKRQKGDGYFDMFRARLIIPIRSPEGRTIAFGGRQLGEDDGPKYLNSRESRLYNKSETLYGLDRARDDIRRTKTAVLVEGYFDCIGLHQAGQRNAVALCSTALTAGHLALLERMEAKTLVLLLDGDEAGRKAVERLAPALLAGGTPTRVATLPEGEDPDTFARREGQAGVQSLLDKAEPLSRHLMQTLLPEGPKATFEGKMAALARLKPVTAALPVGLHRSAFLSALGQHLGLAAQELEIELRGKQPEPVRPVPKNPGMPGPQSSPGRVGAKTPADRPAKNVERPPDALEAFYAAMLLAEPRLQGMDVLRVGDELKHAGLRALVAANAQGVSPADLWDEAPEALGRALRMAQGQVPRDEAARARAFQDACKKLKLRAIDEQLRHIMRETAQLPGAGALLNEDTRRLQEQRVELLALKRRVLSEGTGDDSGTKASGTAV